MKKNIYILQGLWVAQAAVTKRCSDSPWLSSVLMLKTISELLQCKFLRQLTSNENIEHACARLIRNLKVLVKLDLGRLNFFLSD